MRYPIEQQPTVGAMLLLARSAAQMTQHEVARKAGHSAQNVCEWEKGMHRPRSDSFVDVANACGYRVVLVPMSEGG